MKSEIEYDLDQASKKVFAIYTFLDQGEWVCQDFLENLSRDTKKGTQELKKISLEKWRKESVNYLFQTLYSSVILFLCSILETSLLSVIYNIVVEVEKDPFLTHEEISKFKKEGNSSCKIYYNILDKYMGIKINPDCLAKLCDVFSFRNRIVHETGGILLPEELETEGEISGYMAKNIIGYKYCMEAISIVNDLMAEIAQKIGVSYYNFMQC